MTMRLRMALMMMAVAMTAGLTGFAQTTISPGALRRQVERRFDVLPLHDGIALHPKSRTAGVQSVEITDDSIAIDGVPASGRELRDKFGSDADLILKISYLDAD